jgi:protein-S-isoprenylcysteine O-methyltransferase Ste14
MPLPLPPLLAGLAIAATVLTCGLVPLLPAQPGLWAGLATGGIGLGLILAAAVQFARHRTTVNPARPERATALVMTGLNARSRNPMYIGEVLIVLAAGLAANPLVVVPAALGFWLFLDRWQIPAEERALRSRFGAAYQAYCARVPRWL